MISLDHFGAVAERRCGRLQPGRRVFDSPRRLHSFDLVHDADFPALGAAIVPHPGARPLLDAHVFDDVRRLDHAIVPQDDAGVEVGSVDRGKDFDHHGLVARMDRRPPSKRESYAGSNPAEVTITRSRSTMDVHRYPKPRAPGSNPGAIANTEGQAGGRRRRFAKPFGPTVWGSCPRPSAKLLRAWRTGVRAWLPTKR